MTPVASFRSPSLFWFFAVSFGMLVLFLCAWDYIPENGGKEGVYYVFLSFINFIGQGWLQLVFYAAVMAHVLEAIVACVLALQLQCSGSEIALWTTQTLWLGYPSLRLLLAQKSKRS